MWYESRAFMCNSIPVNGCTASITRWEWDLSRWSRIISLVCTCSGIVTGYIQYVARALADNNLILYNWLNISWMRLCRWVQSVYAVCKHVRSMLNTIAKSCLNPVWYRACVTTWRTYARNFVHLLSHQGHSFQCTALFLSNHWRDHKQCSIARTGVRCIFSTTRNISMTTKTCPLASGVVQWYLLT